jgi:hypothetical protein
LIQGAESHGIVLFHFMQWAVPKPGYVIYAGNSSFLSIPFLSSPHREKNRWSNISGAAFDKTKMCLQKDQVKTRKQQWYRNEQRLLKTLTKIETLHIQNIVYRRKEKKWSISNSHQSCAGGEVRHGKIKGLEMLAPDTHNANAC